jgi:hypothetical protein
MDETLSENSCCSVASSDGGMAYTQSAAATLQSSPPPDIQGVARQVQAAIQNTSQQLSDDYKHRNAVYRSGNWCGPQGGSMRASGSALYTPPSLFAASGGNPGGSFSIWSSLQQQAASLQRQQDSQACLPSSGSFSDFFASRRSGHASSGDAFRPAASPVLPVIQALAQDVRSTANSTR